MNEDIITFQTAQQLWNTSFNQKSCETGYRKNGELSYDYALDWINGDGIAAPRQSVLQKWLREEHQLHINIYPHFDQWGEHSSWILASVTHLGSTGGNHICTATYDTYEAALEAGLLYALSLV